MSVEGAVRLLIKNILSFSMNKQFEMCSFWLMGKKLHCVCVFMFGPILWWHMSCPMLWVLPLSCNKTPQCSLKYSWPGKPITLSQSHGFLIITPLCFRPLGHYIPPAASHSPFSFWLHHAQSHNVEAPAQNVTVLAFVDFVCVCVIL